MHLSCNSLIFYPGSLGTGSGCNVLLLYKKYVDFHMKDENLHNAKVVFFALVNAFAFLHVPMVKRCMPVPLLDLLMVEVSVD